MAFLVAPMFETSADAAARARPTVTRTVTQTQTVTATSTATVTQMVTVPPQTVTVTNTQTVTAPAQTVTVTASPTTSTQPGLTPPVAGYATLAQNHDFGSGKTTGAIKDTAALWSRWLPNVFWQAPADPGQAVIQPDRLDLTMTAKNGTFKSVYIETKEVLDPARSYYVEARLKTPGVRNVVPAFWLYANSPDVQANRNGSEGWQSELDIMEQFNPSFGDNTKNFSTTHHAPNHQNINQSIATVTDMSTNWHTVGLEYQPSRVRFYMDGQPSSAWFPYVWTTASTPNAPPALILDIESASTLGVGSATTALPNTMSVDFVRVWQS